MTTTPFEGSGGTTWTTLEEEADLYDALAGTGRVHVEVLGPASPPRNSLPVRLITIDTPDTPPDAPSVLFVGLQHGNEPVGRELLLSTIRDLAEATDVGLLDRCRLHFIPTANPSGFPDWRAVYGQGGINMNREHLSLAVVESEYVQQAITDLDPLAVIDCHEHFAPTDSRLHIEFLPGGHPAGDPGMDALSTDLLEDIQADLDAAAVQHGLYSPTSRDPWVLRGMASIRSRMFLLIETPARNDIVAPATRHYWYALARDTIFDWLDTNLATAAAEYESAKQRQATRTDPIDLINGIILNPAPAAYRLAATDTPRHLNVFGIDHTEQDGTITVPMSQPARGVIPYLLDPDAPEPVATATRVDPPPPPPSGIRLYRTDGTLVSLRLTDGTPATR